MAESPRKGKVEAANVPNVHGDGPAFPSCPAEHRIKGNLRMSKNGAARLLLVDLAGEVLFWKQQG